MIEKATEEEKVHGLRLLLEKEGAAGVEGLLARAKVMVKTEGDVFSVKDVVVGEDSVKDDVEEDKKTFSSFQEAVLREHNLARCSPTEYARSRVLPLLSRYEKRELKDGDRILVTREGAGAAEELLETLRRQKAMGALTLAGGLCRAAERHARDLGDTGKAGHDGSDGSTTQGRIEDQGDWWTLAAENVSLGWKQARDVVLHFLVDDGLENRGHRSNVLNPKATHIGVSELRAHASDLGHCVVVDYTGGFGPKKNVLKEPLKVLATTHQTDDVKRILDSLPRGLDDLKHDIITILQPSNTTTQLILDYKPNSLDVNFITTTNSGTTTKTQSASWGIK